jgi:hypothetical protein
MNSLLWKLRTTITKGEEGQAYAYGGGGLFLTLLVVVVIVLLVR